MLIALGRRGQPLYFKALGPRSFNESQHPMIAMRTLTLKQAAAFLNMHPVTVQEKARAGTIPGAKPGKCWVFLEDDLAAYLRSLYPSTGRRCRVT